MAKQEFNNKFKDLDDNDFEEMTRQIKEGFTSGRLDHESGKRIWWDLRVNVWHND